MGGGTTGICAKTHGATANPIAVARLAARWVFFRRFGIDTTLSTRLLRFQHPLRKHDCRKNARQGKRAFPRVCSPPLALIVPMVYRIESEHFFACILMNSRH